LEENAPHAIPRGWPDFMAIAHPRICNRSSVCSRFPPPFLKRKDREAGKVRKERRTDRHFVAFAFLCGFALNRDDFIPRNRTSSVKDWRL
jgi:hypothetical protein